MNFIELETAQKLRGGFYTEPDIAHFLVRWVASINPATVLEPTCGDGAFLQALEDQDLESLESVLACEIDPVEAEKARSRTSLQLKLFEGDFLHWYLFRAQETRVDAVVGNPPFIRYQYLDQSQQELAARVFADLNLKFTKHTNAWVSMVLAAFRMLRPGGRLAMVVPAEILHIPHAQSLRKHLAESCSQLLLLESSELWFSTALQGTMLLLAEKKRTSDARSKGVGVVSLPRTALFSDPDDFWRSASFCNGETIRGKWMPVLLSAAERSLIAGIRESNVASRFGQLASVDVGIVTGANSFFLVSDSVVDEFSLSEWAHPMFGRSDHVRGVIYDEEDHQENKRLGLPANFLWFPKHPKQRLTAKAKEYIRRGEESGLPKRYKCRIREPWYAVPSVSLSPVAMLKRAHHFPRLVLNSAKAFTTDTAYRIRALAVDAEDLVHSFVNSLTCLSAELEGRHYGGGVLELVPTEIENLLVPVADGGLKTLKVVDEEFRRAVDPVEFVRIQDARVLRSAGLAASEIDNVHNAWLKLKNRRLRNGEEPPTVQSRDPEPASLAADLN